MSLTRRAEPISTTVRKNDVFAAVDAAFAQRRKTLRAALAGWAGSAAAAEAALVAAGVSPQARGESLTVEEFVRIAENRGEASGADTRNARRYRPENAESATESPESATENEESTQP